MQTATPCAGCSAATADYVSSQSVCRFVFMVAGLLFIGIIAIFLLSVVLPFVTRNGFHFSPGRFPALPEKPAVVLRIEPLRVSPLSGVHPSPRVNGIASVGLTATALSPIAVGNLWGGMLFVLITLCSDDSL